MPTVDAAGGDRPSRVLVGRYHLVSFIAGGGMAEVWEGYDSLLARPVAIKLPLAHLARQDTFMNRFHREAVAAARLTHPNVVAVFDTGKDGSDAFIVMELVHGVSLRERLRRSGPLAVEDAVDVAAQVASALDFAHGAGVVHRDVKPANILLSRDGTAKVTDFGIAKAFLDADLTETNVTLGTARYISPEQAEGKRPDGRSDVYSLGVVLYEMLCGRSPFDADNELGIALHHVRTPPIPPSQIAGWVPPWLEEVVLTALEKRPDDRFSTAGRMEKALLEGGGQSGQAKPPTRPPSYAPAIFDDLLDTGDAGSPTPQRGPVRRGGRAGPRLEPGQTDRGGSRPVEEGVAGRPAKRRMLPLVVLALLLAAAATAAALAVRAGHKDSTSARPHAAAPAVTVVPVAGEQSFDPRSDGGDGSEDNPGLSNLLSTEPGSYWQTDIYSNESFGNLKPGVGFVLLLGRSQSLQSVSLATPTAGWNASAYVANAPQPTIQAWGTPVSSASGITGQTSFDLHRRTGAAVLVWITRLGPELTVKVNGVKVTS